VCACARVGRHGLRAAHAELHARAARRLGAPAGAPAHAALRQVRRAGAIPLRVQRALLLTRVPARGLTRPPGAVRARAGEQPRVDDAHARVLADAGHRDLGCLLLLAGCCCCGAIISCAALHGQHIVLLQPRALHKPFALSGQVLLLFLLLLLCTSSHSSGCVLPVECMYVAVFRVGVCS
jgi:hypothetical protein